MSNYFTWSAGRTRQGSPTLESQPGAHTGDTRQYIPGYSDSNIVYLDTASGNDANSGATELLSKLTYSSAATAAGSTKKIRVINDGAALSTNITKPTEMKRGVSGTISSSLTAPVDTWTQAATPSFGTDIVLDVTWAQSIKKYIAVGLAGKIAYSSDGDTWTQAATPSFGATGVYSVAWSESLRVGVAVGASDKIAYSTNGDSWVQVTSVGINANFYSVIWADELGLFLAAGEVRVLPSGASSAVVAYSSDGVNWVQPVIVGIGINAINDIAWSGSLRLLVAGDTVGGLYYSSNGINWTPANTPAFSAGEVRGISWSEAIGKFIAVGESVKIAYSTDGDIWTAAATPSFGTDTVNDVTWSAEIGKYVAVGNSGKIAYSSDGDTWTQAATPSFGASNILAICSSPFIGKLISCGASGKVARSTAFANTISAAIAGFTVQAVQYSGTVTAYSCTMKQPGTTAALSLNACRLTESGAHISNNAATLYQTLVEGDIHYAGTYAAANALDINLNTIAGTLYIYNGSETHYERIRDNIIEGGVQASYPVTVTSGNTRGTSSNGVIFGALHTTSDPLFVDETDYKLKRVLDGYQYDSPMVAASLYYYNQATTQTFRDNGAWSYNESAASYKYQRTKDFLMPAAANGGTITTLRHNRANLHVAEDGTPDVVNTPDSRWEEIVMTYKTLPADHIDFIDWLEGKVDMRSNISLSPSLTPTTSVTASGATSAGEAVITVTDNTGLDSGDRLTIDGNEYTVLYTYGTTKVVLDRITTTALSNGESITVKYDTGFYEYQYVPNNDRSLTRWYETNTEYFRGLVVRFARKLP